MELLDILMALLDEWSECLAPTPISDDFDAGQDFRRDECIEELKRALAEADTVKVACPECLGQRTGYHYVESETGSYRLPNGQKCQDCGGIGWVEAKIWREP